MDNDLEQRELTMRIKISENQLALMQARKAELDQAVQIAQLANARLADVIAAASDQDLAQFAGFNFGRDGEGSFVDLQEKA
jgi:hypothetical protein